MRHRDLLLFIVVTLGGFVKAAPSLTKLDKRIGTDDSPPFPFLTTQVLTPQATSFQFYRDKGWDSDSDVKKDHPALNVFNKMSNDGLFTAVVLRSSHSSIVGPGSGLTTPDDYIASNNPGTALITNGAFYITGSDPDLVSDFNNGQKGKPLPPDQFKGYSVGPTSVTKNTVDIPSVYADIYHRFTADDMTFFTSGPDLKNPVDTTVPPVEDANTNAGRLQYFVRDGTGQRIPLGSGKYEQSEFTHVPGGVVTANENNERAVLVIVDRSTKIVCAYTSERAAGMTMNEMRDLISVFMQNYMEDWTIDRAQVALNLDGGRSVYIAWVDNGKTEVLAAGNLANPTREHSGWKPREVTTMVKHSFLAVPGN